MDKGLMESAKQFLMQVDTNINIESVILSDENKKLINEFTEEIHKADLLVENNLHPMNRLLFHGDSGTGKTFLGKALSNHLGYKMLYVDIASALSSGDVADNLKTIFLLAEENRKDGHKSIIFLDEADSIAWARDTKTSESGQIRRATNSLFQLIDQMHYTTIVICATNMAHRLDPAFKARFNLIMDFRRPDTDIRYTIQKFLYKNFTLIDDIDNEENAAESIINRRLDLSYREIEFIVQRNMKKAVLSGTHDIKLSDLLRDLAISNGIQINGL